MRIEPAPPSADEALAAVADPAAGGTCVFVGTVRDRSSGGEDVTELTYEAWDELAKERLDEIAAAIRSALDRLRRRAPARDGRPWRSAR